MEDQLVDTGEVEDCDCAWVGEQHSVQEHSDLHHWEELSVIVEAAECRQGGMAVAPPWLPHPVHHPPVSGIRASY